jgi:hypothetical protein
MGKKRDTRRGADKASTDNAGAAAASDRLFEVAWPRGEKAIESIPLAKRLDTLEGKTIGIMWDWVYRGDEMFPVVEEELAKRFPGITFVGYDEFGNPHSAHEAEVLQNLPGLAEKHGCDAFIVGVGC